MESPSSGVASPAGGRARGSVLLSPVSEAVTPSGAASVPGAPGAEVPEPDVVSDLRTPGAEDAEMHPEQAPAEASSEEEDAEIPVETWADSLQEASDMQGRKYVEGLLSCDVDAQSRLLRVEG